MNDEYIRRQRVEQAIRDWYLPDVRQITARCSAPIEPTEPPFEPDGPPPPSPYRMTDIEYEVFINLEADRRDDWLDLVEANHYEPKDE